MQNRCLVAAALFALAACAALDPRTPRIVEIDGIVAEPAQLARAPATEQKAALARAHQASLADASAANRLRLATFLATLPEPLRADARAGQLLDPRAATSPHGSGPFPAS